MKASGMLIGVAVGDALGMPSEFLTRKIIMNWYGDIQGLVDVNQKHPHHKLHFGSVTDDTDHTLIIANMIIGQGGIKLARFADALYAWSQTGRVQENNFVGPSTLKTLAALKENVPLDKLPRFGTSVGASMRVAPIAIAFGERQDITEQVIASCSVSLFTNGAISGAMAMAYALSESLQQKADIQSIVIAAKEGAVLGRKFGEWNWCGSIERRIDYVCDWVESYSKEEVLNMLADVIGVDLYPEQLVPSAIGLLLLSNGDPMSAMLMAANLGGDSDTLASMVGAICGGLKGESAFMAETVETVINANQLELQSTVKKLIHIRNRKNN